MSEAEPLTDSEKAEMAERLLAEAHEGLDSEYEPEVAEDVQDRLDAARAAERLLKEDATEDLSERVSELAGHTAQQRAEIRQELNDLKKQALSKPGREMREEMALRMALSKAEENGGKWRLTTTDVAVELGVSQRSAQNYCKSVAAENSGIFYRQLGGKYQGVNQKGLEVSLGEYDGEFADEFSVE